MEFRPDINALRALAVLTVVFYHFRIPGFDGGFVGVDVFFVISGFLMTSIIASGIEKQKFSLLSFYWARAKRIIPALMVLCLVLLLAGWFILPPADYKLLGSHVASALSFVSNFVLKSEEGYFDTLSQEKWLLHTWSLSAEWQFYLIYPLLLLAFKKHLHRTLWIMFGVTFAFSIFISPLKPAFSFYLLPTRIWEMVAGGLVYFYASKFKLNHVQSTLAPWVGFGLILLSVQSFSGTTVWPGYNALLPVLGAVLMLWSPRERMPIASNAIIQRLGDWSYSIYLWHWPILVALRYYGVDREPLWIAYGITMSFLMAAMSYYWVETPIRKSTWLRDHFSSAFKKSLFILTVVILFSLSAVWTKGFPSRVNDRIHAVEAEMKNYLEKPPPCDETCQKNGPAFAVWGDSHAVSLYDAVQEAAKGKYGEMWAHSSCPPIFNASVEKKKKREECVQQNDKAFDNLQKLKENTPLFIISRYSLYLIGYSENPENVPVMWYKDLHDIKNIDDRKRIYGERLTASLCKIKKAHPRTYVVKPVPELKVHVAQNIARQMMIKETGISEVYLPLSEYYQRHQVVLKALDDARAECGVQLLDPVPYLCKDGSCRGSVDLQPLYHDDDHLSLSGNDYLVPLFKPFFR